MVQETDGLLAMPPLLAPAMVIPTVFFVLSV